MRKKHLEIILSRLDRIDEPKLELEQYSTPPDVAAEMLNLAFLSGDIEGKVVLDLGCGAGGLGIGAALLGASFVLGVDIDEDVLRVAKGNASRLGDLPIRFVRSDVRDFDYKCDTVLQNPPFGIQSLQRDIVFLERAMSCAKKVYSIHPSSQKTRRYLTKLVRQLGGRVLEVKEFDFAIPHLFQFHQKPRKRIRVDLYVIEAEHGAKGG